MINFWKLAVRVGCCVVALFALAGCSSLQRAKRSLPADDREFLSIVRYIISADEERRFVSLPESDREAFIEEFWKKRDPDLNTEENEFKATYFQRIDEANHLFRESGRARGWMSDRGRIYILLGPPEWRDSFPTGRTLYELPLEIWYYGNFPIVFRDYNRSGSFQLEPLSAQQVTILGQAQQTGHFVGEGQVQIREFEADLRWVSGKKGGEVRGAVPYRLIWLTPRPDGVYETTLELTATVKDLAGNVVKTEKGSFPVRLVKGQTAKLGKKFTWVLPISLAPGEYQLDLLLENLTGHVKAVKTLRIKR